MPSSAINTADLLVHLNRAAEELKVGPECNVNNTASAVTSLRNGNELARLATPRVGSGSDSKASEAAANTCRETPKPRVSELLFLMLV